MNCLGQILNLNFKKIIRLGSTFSGIGSIENALKRLNLNYKIMFAGDIDPFVNPAIFEL